MISDSQTYYRVAPWLVIFPGLAIVVRGRGVQLPRLRPGTCSHRDGREGSASRQAMALGRVRWPVRVAPLPCLLACALPAAREHGPPPRASCGPRARDDIPTLDPAVGYDTASWQFEQMLFNTLVDYDDDSASGARAGGALGGRAPTGASSPSASIPAVRFSTAGVSSPRDVQYSIERVLRPGHASQGAEFFRGIDGRRTPSSTGSARQVSRHRDARRRDGANSPAPPSIRSSCTSWRCRSRPSCRARWWRRTARTSRATRSARGRFVLDEWQRGQRLRAAPQPALLPPRRAVARRQCDRSASTSSSSG